MLFVLFFFFKQKTAYELRISDWSSDVCSSDLGAVELAGAVTVAGSDDAVGVQIAGAGALSLTSAQDFTVTSSAGEATGAAMIGGTSQAAAFTGAVAITGADVRPGSVSWVHRAPYALPLQAIGRANA